MQIRRRLFQLVVCACAAGATGAASLYGAGVQKINSLIVNPDLVYVSSPTAASFTANVAYNPTLLTTSVTLTQVTAAGKLIRTIGRMYDDGTHGDAVANDFNFTVQLTLSESLPVKFYYRATAAYRAVIARAQSELAMVSVAKPSYATPPDPIKVVVDSQKGKYPVNQLLFSVPPGTPESTVNSIIGSVGGKLIGYSSTASLYQVQVTAATIAQLDAAISKIKANPVVTFAEKNYIGLLQAAPVVNDLTNLSATPPGGFPNAAGAYNLVNAKAAYQLLADTDAILAPVVVGVTDTGVAKSSPLPHAEFNGVNVFGHVPADLQDGNGHGTSVAGIIGANCVSCGGGAYSSSQMNGILAGVPGTTPGAVKVPYTIASRALPGLSYAELTAAIDDAIARNSASVVAISTAWQVQPIGSVCPADSCITQGVLNQYTTDLRAVFQSHADVTFVIAAGNYSGLSTNTFPANLYAEANAITVGATDLSDQRLANSNYGPGVTMAAPGTVYAPTIPSGYRTFTGTSAAAAMVAGAAGLLRSVNPGLDPANIRRLLVDGAKQIATDHPVGKRLDLHGAVSLASRPVDVFFLIDTTGSMTGAILGIQASANAIAQTLYNNKLNVYFGVSNHRDYPISPYGAPGDFPYARVQDIAPPTVEANSNLNIVNAVNTLTLGDGLDLPESQLAALLQAATGSGQDTGNPSAGDYIPAGQQASWRPCAGSPSPAKCDSNVRIVILATDASFHVPSDGPPPYPGPDFGPTITALNNKGIKVIGIQPSTNSLALNNLKSVASGTGTLAPEPIDCLGNGTFIVPAGQPIVCQASPSGTGVDTSIVNAILGLIKTPIP